MSRALAIRTDIAASELRRLAKCTQDKRQSRRLRAVAAVLDGIKRADAARINGVERQTLCAWIHRFNQSGSAGLLGGHGGGREPRLSAERKAELAALVKAGTGPTTDGVGRWRRVDLQRAIKERFNIDYHVRYVGTILKQMRLSTEMPTSRRLERVAEAVKPMSPDPE
jgi:transposase